MNNKTRILVVILIIIVILCGGIIAYKFYRDKSQNVASNDEEPQNTVEEPPLEVEIKTVQTFKGDERPIAVMIDNHKAALPQGGLNNAYMVYEIIVEGGESRLMALFKGQNLEKIGPVRSSRHYFLDYALENDAIYVHYGWSPQAQYDISNLGVNNINGISESESSFWRVKDKRAPHNVATSTAKILSIAERKGYKTTSTKESVLKYVKFVKGTTDNGYPIIHVYVENPIEYKFNLKKLDTEGNLLSGTEFEVTSSNSGKHYLNGNNQMTFIEEDLEPGMIVSYQITEKNTVENSAYENVFNKALTMVLKVNEDGTLKELMSFVEGNSSNGGHTQVPLKNLDFLEYGISDPDSEGIQTVYFTFENPTTVDVELLKKQTGKNGAPISNTEFTIISSFSGTYREFTDQSGKIGFSEKKIPAGKYSYGENQYTLSSGSKIQVSISQSQTGTSYLTFQNRTSNSSLRFTNTKVTNGWKGTVVLGNISSAVYSFGIENASSVTITYTGSYSL